MNATFNTIEEWATYVREVKGETGLDPVIASANRWLDQLPKYMLTMFEISGKEEHGVFKDPIYKDKDWFEKVILSQIVNEDKGGWNGLNIYQVMEEILEFTAYDDGLLRSLLDENIIPVLEAICLRSTFDYIDGSREQYKNYIMVCNLGKIPELLNWGGSIRGAWFDIRDYGFEPFMNGDKDHIIETMDDCRGFFIALICFYKSTIQLTDRFEMEYGNGN